MAGSRRQVHRLKKMSQRDNTIASAPIRHSHRWPETAFRLIVAVVILAICDRAALADPAAAEISGELKKWHRVTLTFTGPESSETATPNPFRDYRLIVAFRQGTRAVFVPGFFAADGAAAESGASAGDKWRVHFTPDAEGEWQYVATFRSGKDIAVSFDMQAGRPAGFDRARGTFTVGPSDKQGRDHRAQGLLQYVGEHYLRFAETGEPFIKGGADSPENFLGYADFDGTSRHGKKEVLRSGEAVTKDLHQYQPHVKDWRDGDPTWRGGHGKGMIGALNYLASKGMNSVYFLTMNVEGDGKDVWPWTGPGDRDRFDCSKLDQWEIVFSHMDRLGILLHVITQETENDQLLDKGDLGITRKLYYRELAARFAHHPAVIWNLGEENTNTDKQRKEFCTFIRGLDPYDHPIVVHTFPGKYDQVYEPLLGFKNFEGPSLQTNDTHAQTKRWVARSGAAGRKWIVCLDEIGPAHTGVKPDADDPNHDDVRWRHLWGNLMAGGAGCEWYFGYKFAHNDLNCEDWRSRERVWDQTRFALEFFHEHLPFTEMCSADQLTNAPSDYCFTKLGHVYAVYLPRGGSTELFLPDAAYRVRWYNPRQGGPLSDGSATKVKGPGFRSIGTPPKDPTLDWVALVKLDGPPPQKIETPDIPDRPVAADMTGVAVESFTIINTQANRPLAGFEKVTGEVTLDLGKLRVPGINVVANLSGGSAGSVRFALNGDSNYRTENTAPYAIEGDTGGQYGAWKPGPGTYTIVAKPFARRNAAGPQGKALTLRLKIVR
jgi:hypothetical protein